MIQTASILYCLKLFVILAIITMKTNIYSNAEITNRPDTVIVDNKGNMADIGGSPFEHKNLTEQNQADVADADENIAMNIGGSPLEHKNRTGQNKTGDIPSQKNQVQVTQERVVLRSRRVVLLIRGHTGSKKDSKVVTDKVSTTIKPQVSNLVHHVIQKITSSLTTSRPAKITVNIPDSNNFIFDVNNSSVDIIGRLENNIVNDKKGELAKGVEKVIEQDTRLGITVGEATTYRQTPEVSLILSIIAISLVCCSIIYAVAKKYIKCDKDAEILYITEMNLQPGYQNHAEGNSNHSRTTREDEVLLIPGK